MKIYLTVISFFLIQSVATAAVEIVTEVDNGNLLVGLYSENNTIHQGGHLQFFIDSDNNSNTGYSQGDIVGADYLLEDNELYISTPGSGWSWNYVGNTNFYTDEMPTYVDTTTLLGDLSLSTNTTIKVGAHALNNNWTTVASYHGSSMTPFVLGSGGSSTPFSVYNQAYQEDTDNGYQADTINDINNANNAYVLIDTFGSDGIGFSNHIAGIQNNGNQVSGYISAGTGENWRLDYNALLPFLSNQEWGDWEGEFFIKETTTGVLDIMKNRIDNMASKGVQWVEFDNMDWLGSADEAGAEIQVTPQQAKDYLNALCDYTHQQGMKCMAKNVTDGFSNFDGVTYESFPNNLNWWADNSDTSSFLNAGKTVVIIHYKENNCDSTYSWYKNKYSSDKISFTCAETSTKKYKHY